MISRESEVPRKTNAFGRRIRRDRLDAKLSIRQLAALVSIDFSYVSKIETGSTQAKLSLEVVRSLAVALDADQMEYFRLSGFLPDPLSKLLQFDATREFLQAAAEQPLTEEDWIALNQLLKKRIAIKRKTSNSAA